MEIYLQKVQDEELNLAIHFLKELYTELGEESESIEFLTTSFLYEMANTGKTDIYIINTRPDDKIGIVTLTTSQAIYAGGEYGVIDEMYIIPEYRSKQVGSKVIAEIKRIGQTKKWNRIDVTAPTDEAWVRTIHFYKQNGFVYTGPKLKLDTR
jgi:GNAT superfamily N-acetyltransferase